MPVFARIGIVFLAVLLVSACTLNTSSQATDTSLPADTPPPVGNNLDNLPAVGFADIVVSGVAECVLRNTASVPVIVYDQPGGKAVAGLQPGMGLPGFMYQNEGYNTAYNLGDTQLGGWIPANTVSLEGDCLALQPPPGCSVQPSVGRVIDIYAQPDRSSQIVNALNERYFVPLLSISADGWFNVDMGNGLTGWIAPDEGQLAGACENGQ